MITLLSEAEAYAQGYAIYNLTGKTYDYTIYSGQVPISDSLLRDFDVERCLSMRYLKESLPLAFWMTASLVQLHTSNPEFQSSYMMSICLQEVCVGHLKFAEKD